MIPQHLLSFLIFAPLAAAVLALLIPSSQKHTIKWITLLASVVQMMILLVLLKSYSTASSGYQFLEQTPWITIDLGTMGTFRAEYLVGVDGLNFPLVMLSIVVMLVATVASWKVQTHAKGYFVLLLILNTSIVGTFCALDLLLFYLFFEFTLLPMYFLIGIWGGQRREYASIKFFLYTLLGSILILLVIIGLYLSSSVDQGGQLFHTFNLIQLTDPFNIAEDTILHPQTEWTIMGYSPRLWAFLLLLIGFGIKLPIVPFHTWLPDAHVEASTPISVILAALLLKIGGYGIARTAFPLFPDAAIYFTWLVALIGMISIIYGALNALASKDLKRLIAYSSVSHMGFVLLGFASLTAEGWSGGIFQMASHGLISSMLFLLAGVLYDRTGDRQIANYSGLSGKMPMYTATVLIAFFATLGLPGLSGFIGEVLILLGAFRSDFIPGWIVVVSTTGLILAAGYCLWTIQRMFLGPFASRVEGALLTDLTATEKALLFSLAAGILVLGIFPQLLIRYINPFAQQMVEFISGYSGSL